MMKIGGGVIDKDVVVKVGLDGDNSEKQPKNRPAIRTYTSQIVRRIVGAAIRVQVLALDHYYRIPDIDPNQNQQKRLHNPKLISGRMRNLARPRFIRPGDPQPGDGRDKHGPMVMRSTVNNSVKRDEKPRRHCEDDGPAAPKRPCHEQSPE